MVLAEKSAEVRNGKSRGPSPNGHGSPDSSSENEDEKIRVGRDYQAVCPELEPLEKRRPDMLAERALLVWSPTADISDAKLDNYITVAKDKYGYNAEQALGMLFWHKHDLNRASMDLANFTPFPDEWTVEDKVLFEQAFQFHGKSFHRIRHMLPDKSVASLVKYYYSWKKTRARTSLMDVVSDNRNAAGASSSKRDSGANSEKDASDKEASDSEEKVQENKQQLSTLKRKIGSTGNAGVELARPGEPLAKINSRWTSEELLMAVTAVKKYGKDFNAIAEIIGTKTEAHVRTFFISYRRRYNLDAILKEYEAERGNTGSAENSESAMTETNRSSNGDSSGEATLVQDSVEEEKGEVDSEAASLGASSEEGTAAAAVPAPAAPAAPAVPGPSQAKPRAAN